VRLPAAMELESRRRRFKAGEVDLDLERPRDECWDRYDSAGDLDRGDPE